MLNATCLCWFTKCVLLYDNVTDTWMLVTIGIRFKQHYDTLGILGSAILKFKDVFARQEVRMATNQNWPQPKRPQTGTATNQNGHNP